MKFHDYSVQPGNPGKTRLSSCASLPVDWLLLLLQHVRLIYVSPFCFPATPGPFDSPKGKACQKNIYATFVAALDSKVSPPSPSPPLFLSSIHPCFHSSVVSHQTYLQELGVSFSIFYFSFFFLYLASLGSAHLFITLLSQC